MINVGQRIRQLWIASVSLFSYLQRLKNCWSSTEIIGDLETMHNIFMSDFSLRPVYKLTRPPLSLLIHTHIVNANLPPFILRGRC